MRLFQVCPAALLTTLLLLLIAWGTSGGQTPPRRTPPLSTSADTVVFAVKKNPADSASTGDSTIDPVVVIRRGRLTAPPIETEVEGATAANNGKRFVANFYRPHRQYRLLFGGVPSGTVSVVSYEEPGCVGLSANARLQTALKLGGEVDAPRRTRRNSVRRKARVARRLTRSVPRR